MKHLIAALFLICLATTASAQPMPKPPYVAGQEEITWRAPTAAEQKLIDKIFLAYYSTADPEYFTDIRTGSTDFHIAPIIVDDEKTPAYIVAYENIMWCGTAGCSVDVWVKINGTWELVGGGRSIAVGGTPLRYPTKHNGFYDLYIGMRLEWDGKEYQSIPGPCEPDCG